jgi:hypothetical protein
MLEPEEYTRGVTAARAVYEGDQDIEAVVLAMKQRGFSVIESIRALMEIAGLGLAEATRRVHFSSAWPEVRG